LESEGGTVKRKRADQRSVPLTLYIFDKTQIKPLACRYIKLSKEDQIIIDEESQVLKEEHKGSLIINGFRDDIKLTEERLTRARIAFQRIAIERRTANQNSSSGREQSTIGIEGNQYINCGCGEL
jgi:hypothetical protein